MYVRWKSDLGQLELTYADGTTEVIASDGSRLSSLKARKISKERTQTDWQQKLGRRMQSRSIITVRS